MTAPTAVATRELSHHRRKSNPPTNEIAATNPSKIRNSIVSPLIARHRWPNEKDHRGRVSDAHNQTGALSRRSVHPLWLSFYEVRLHDVRYGLVLGLRKDEINGSLHQLPKSIQSSE